MKQRERLSTRLVIELRRLIAEEGFEPGQKFYSESQLIERLQVSRPSVREALKILEGNKEIEVIHGKGVFIGEERLPGLESLSEYVRANEESLREHFDVRLLIEPEAARRASERRTDSDIEELQTACDAFRESVYGHDYHAAVAADTEFHTIIARCTRNKTIHLLMRTMAQSLTEGWLSSLSTRGRLEASIAEHLAIFHAIVDKRPDEAASAMNQHLTNALNQIQSEKLL